MSYIKRPLGASPMDVVDPWGVLSPVPMPGDASDEKTCLDKANASPQVSSMDAIVNSLASTWNPTGYYRPADVQAILDAFATQAEDAGAALAAAPLSTSDALDVKAQAFDDVQRIYQDQSKNYQAAVNQAKATGATVINAPGLKDWVISSMRTLSDAYVTATVLQCRQSWVESVLDRGYRAMAAIGSVAARILGVVAKVGEAGVDALEKAADLTAIIIKYAPYAAAAIGAYMLYNMVVKK